MGKTVSTPRVYATFSGPTKPGESRILHHVMPALKPDEPQDMLTELE